MKLSDPKYAKYALCKEMLETVDVIRNFKTKDLSKAVESLKTTGKLFMTGEGSSRIFPAKHTINLIQKNGFGITAYTEGSRQAAELKLKEFTMFGASNSGKTKEVISLFKNKEAAGKFALIAHENTPLGAISDDEFILNCGNEDAVAATKSVIEQALFYHQLIKTFIGASADQCSATVDELADKSKEVLEMEIDPELIAVISKADVIYFAGRNVGVAEEAALKTNEITRKKSAYLEGTYAVHGIEEVMTENEVVILVDPYKEEEEKFKEVLLDGVGMKVIAISDHDTMFPTIKIPLMGCHDAYLQLQACWNVLVEVGIACDVDLDHPTRARKVGNEFIG
ncbi:MAG: sugar isomerase [Candidatus Marinimicrobia bacterium]|nr:sugar isomerase [Candidatus Neomarinimicrobiota bacterium]